ncbi:MAG: putative bifunctional diguanylate cyclase/phosphodiesterase [Acidimicrobiia bacterium]
MSTEVALSAVARPARTHTRPVRGLTVLVFAVLMAASFTAAHATRRMLDNQEQEMLEQRATEAAALLSTLVTQVRMSLGTLVTAVQVAGPDPQAFAQVAGNLQGYDTVTLVDGQGDRIAPAPGLPAAELAEGPTLALRQAVTADDVVPTPIFKVGEERRMGFALAVPDSTWLVYAERTLTDPGRQRRVTSGDAFSELNGAMYASAQPDPTQLVLTTGGTRPGGHEVTRPVRAGAGTWSVVISARHPLLGSMAQNTPWLFFAGGLVTAVLMAGLVEVLARRRRYAWGLVAERTEELREAAVHDALTGLPNRKLLVDRLDQALARQIRGGRSVALLFLDLDRFKLLNDSRGHAIGDQVLVTVAERLRQVVRPADTVARFGGDEFVVVCEDVDGVADATGLAERIAAALEVPFSLDGGEVFLSVSVGVSMAGPGSSAEELLRDADAAMYRAKEHGRSRIEFFDEGMRTEAGVRLEVQNALHRAVERDELRLLYQPVIDLPTGRMVGVEALLRWAHPEQGVLPPGLFVPMAEELGLIVPIGNWVFAEAARQLAEWQRAAPQQPPLVLAVNLSTRQLREPGLVDTFRRIITETGIDPTGVCLELTETVLMEDPDLYLQPLLDLKALGLRLAVDDFGTGHASLSYLKRFPFDVLKIDRSFVRGLGRDAADTAIVRGVIDLAHALGLEVVAEGIEDREHLVELRALGCDLAQGYHFARPLPAAAISALLAPAEFEISLA